MRVRNLIQRNRHAVARARERYGVNLDIPDVRELLRQCRNGQCVAIKAGAEWHFVELPAVVMLAVYLRTLDCLGELYT